jgi:hypothetical protein
MMMICPLSIPILEKWILWALCCFCVLEHAWTGPSFVTQILCSTSYPSSGEWIGYLCTPPQTFTYIHSFTPPLPCTGVFQLDKSEKQWCACPVLDVACTRDCFTFFIARSCKTPYCSYCASAMIRLQCTTLMCTQRSN